MATKRGTLVETTTCAFELQSLTYWRPRQDSSASTASSASRSRGGWLLTITVGCQVVAYHHLVSQGSEINVW